MRTNVLKKNRLWFVSGVLILSIIALGPLARANENKQAALPVLRVHPVPPNHVYRAPFPTRLDSVDWRQGIPAVKGIPAEANGMEWLSSPAFAAAAANYRLVYTRATIDTAPFDKDLFIVGENGSGLIKLAGSIDKEYFDGEVNGRIIYSRLTDGNQLDIYSVLKNGTGTLPLAIDPEHELFIAISGNRVIYAKNFDDASQYGDFYSVTCEGKDQKLLASGVYYGDVLGEWLVYMWERNSGNYDLYSVKNDGTLTTVLADASEGEYYAGSYRNWVIFHRELLSNVDLYAMPADGSYDRPVCLAATPRDEKFAGVGVDRVYYNQAIDDNVNYRLNSVLINGSGTKPVTTGYGLIEFAKEFGSRVVVRKMVENVGLDLYSIKTSGDGEIRLTQATIQVDYVGMSGNWVVFTDGYGDLYQAFGVNILGGSPVMLSDWLNPGKYEWVEVDPVSQKVIISKLRNSQIDLNSMTGSGTKRTRFTSNTYRDFYLFSTANCYIYCSLINDQWDLFSYNFRTGQTRVLANSTSYHEAVPLKGGGPVQ